MSRGLGQVQRAIIDAANAHPEGLAIHELVAYLHGPDASAAQRESVRRAVRALLRVGLVERSTRWETRPRKSLRRFVDIAPCDAQLCRMCGERKRRRRLSDWHREVMNTNAQQGPGWLDDLAAAEQSGFVHEVASDERLVDEQPETVDLCQ